MRRSLVGAPANRRASARSVGRRGGNTSVLSSATCYWKANRYSGSGALLDLTGRGRDAALGPGANAPTFLPYTGEKYVYLPGLAGNYLSAPDSAAVSITGDITIDVKVAMDNWTPPAANVLVSKLSFVAGNYSYDMYISTGGLVVLRTSTTGSNLLNNTSTIAVGAVNGTAKWIRGSLDVDNGAGSRVCKMYTSNDGVTWTPLGDTVTTAGTGAPFDGNAQVEIGSNQGGLATVAGKLYQVRIYNSYLQASAGTPVFDWRADSCFEPFATCVESSVNAATVTLNRTVAGKKTAVVDRSMFLFGTDDYMEVADHADINFGANQDFTVVAIARFFATTINSTSLMSKRTIISYGAAGEVGYNLRKDVASTILISDGGEAGFVGCNVIDPVPTLGLLTTFSGKREGLARMGRVTNATGTATATQASAAAGSLTNTNVLRIGRLSGANVNYADMEFVAAALFRRALTTSEIARLGTELLVS